jgi:E3 ubiquitin-protein ligase TRIP12
MAAPGPSRVEDEDVEMMDVEYKHEASDHDDQIDLAHDDRDGGEDEDGNENTGGRLPGDGTGEEDGGGIHNGIGGLPRGFAGLDESAAMAIFADYRQLGSYMSGLSSRLKTMLNNIKTNADPTTRVVTLQELSELLSISTEDTLAGSFQVDAFVRELVKILGGSGNAADDDDGDDDDDSHEHDEDAQLAAVLAISGGGQYQGDDNLEAQVLAARCLANLMEALPGVAHTVVYHGAIPVLCSKLIEISYIDLAEQTLSVCSFYHLITTILTPRLVDSGKNFRRVSEFNRPREWPCRVTQLPRFLLDRGAAYCPTGGIELLPKCASGTFPNDP